MLYQNFTIQVPRFKILARMGYLDGQKIPSDLHRKIERVLTLGHLLSEPIGATIDLEIKKISPRQTTFKNSNLKIVSADIAKLLQGCKKATLLACTIGNKLMHYTATHQKKGEIASAMLLDAFGSEAVEEAAEEITRRLARRAGKTKHTLTFRFACGYGDWNLQDQPKILATLDTPNLNIRVGKGGIMEPQKSITALIGWQEK